MKANSTNIILLFLLIIAGCFTCILLFDYDVFHIRTKQLTWQFIKQTGGMEAELSRANGYINGIYIFYDISGLDNEDSVLINSMISVHRLESEYDKTNNTLYLEIYSGAVSRKHPYKNKFYIENNFINEHTKVFYMNPNKDATPIPIRPTHNQPCKDNEEVQD